MKINHDKIFITVMGLIFVALMSIFLCFPRSTFSEVERRELATFPEFSVSRLADGSFTEDVSRWFSDTEPFRDVFMEAHHKFRKKLAFNFGEGESVSFVEAPGGAAPGVDIPGTDGRELADFEGGNAKIASAGIVVTGEPGKVRALMAFGGSDKGHSPFAEALNYVKRQLGPGVNVYSMIIPTAIEFYCPEQVKGRTRSQAACLRNIYSQIDKNVRIVDSYTVLGKHVAEPIYLRTDHHWAPLGAYYAAGQLARTAGVPFRDIKEYNAGVTRNFVGTMYGYSRDISVKESPEDFIYYTPKNKNYTTWYTIYNIDKDFHVRSEQNPVKGQFFMPHKDGSGAAYTTMMGGDSRAVKVITGTPGKRKVLIIKDSFGNAVPGFLFGSFAEVHVIDFRYFPHNMKKYVADNSITDVVYCVNIFNAYSGSVAGKFKKMISGTGFYTGPVSSEENKPADKKPEENKGAEEPRPAPEPAKGNVPGPSEEPVAPPAEPTAAGE